MNKRPARWKTSEPPKRKTRDGYPKAIKLRYCYGNQKPHQGTFAWSDTENTWIEVVIGPNPDGIALYKEDGWRVLGWR